MNREEMGIESADGAVPASSTGFEEGLRLARTLMDRGDTEGALAALYELEDMHVRGAVLFDLLGDVLLARGKIGEGVRYKTLFQALRGTFRIVAEETARDRLKYEQALVREPDAPCPIPEESDEAGIVDFVPMAAAMAQEFLRQGHYDRAARIFAELGSKSPEDASLKEGRELALRKLREKRMLLVFRRWLSNIEQIRSGGPARP